MGFDVSTLTNYVDQTSENLISRAYFENTSAQNFSLQTGIKTVAALQLFAVTAVPQADSGCAFNASGNVAFTQRNITVGAIKYEDALCLKDLKAKWTQVLLKAGSQAEGEEITFEEEIVNDLISLIKEHIEVQDWQGDITSGNAYLNKYDGLIKIIDAAGTATDGNTGNVTTTTGITGGASGNAAQLIWAMCDARSTATKSQTNQILFCGTDTFDKVVDTLIQKNMYHVDPTNQDNEYTMKIVGRNVTLKGVAGLDGTDRMFLGKAENFVLGVDLADEEEVFDMWYSKDDKNVKYTVAFKRGVQVAYPSEIVEFTLATP